MKNTKKLLLVISMIFIVTNSANAQTNLTNHNGDRYNDLSYEYFYSKNSNVPVSVKRVIASDPQTSTNVLKILTNDSDATVWLLAKDNLENMI